MINWRREWQPTPVFLPGKPHGQKSLAGYSPCSPKAADIENRLMDTVREGAGGTN